MTGNIDETVAETARGWAIRVADPAFADWDAFTAWLEGDAAHLPAYDAAVADEAWADALFATPVPRPLAAPAAAIPVRAHRGYRYGAVAAAVAVVAATGSWIALRDTGPRTIVTAIGEHRTVDLGDGSRVALNGGTRITLDAGARREVVLAQGEALFTIRHDSAQPFVVRTGATRLVDAGTVFNVVTQRGALDVAVAEGAVLYGAGGRRLRLDAGQGLSRANAGAEPVRRAVMTATVGTWRAGYLQYADAALDRIAADLSRNLGQPVTVAAATSAMPRFSGTVMLNGAPDQVMARTGPLLGVRVVRAGDGWRMTPIDGIAR